MAPLHKTARKQSSLLTKEKSIHKEWIFLYSFVRDERLELPTFSV